MWRQLLPEYRERVTALTRRAETLSLGDYTLGLLAAWVCRSSLFAVWTVAVRGGDLVTGAK